MDEAISDRLQLRYAEAEEGKNRGHEGVSQLHVLQTFWLRSCFYLIS